MSSDTLALLVDTTRPATPVLQSYFDDVGIYTGNLASGTPSNDPTPLMTGTAEANSTVTIKDAGTPIGTTTANAAGVWNFTPTLLDGTHQLTMTSTDAAGNESLPVAYTAVIDTVPPATPTILVSHDNFGIYMGDIPENTPTNDTTPLLSGTAEANSLVTIFDGTTILGSTTATPAGTWAFTTPALIGQGLHALKVMATDAAGNESVRSDTWDLLLDTQAPGTPFISASNDNFGIYLGDIPGGVSTNDSTPRLSGTAEAQSLVTVFDGGVYMGTTTADGAGNWNFTPTLTGDRTHAMTITATDAAGNVSNSSSIWNVALDTTVPATPLISASNDNVGTLTGNIGNGLVTNDATPELSGTAEAGSLVTVFDGGAPIGTTMATAAGTWTYTTPALSDRTHAITVTSTDAAGNESLHSGTNANGKLDSGDALWKEMNVWQDLNGNSISDAGEVKTLEQWGIASINLTSDGVESAPAPGVHEYGKTSATLTDGSQMVVADIAFETVSMAGQGGIAALPFLVDLNQDGIISYGKSMIDLDGAGVKKSVAWAGKGDGVLVWDKYHDGQVHDSSQYSFGAVSGDKSGMSGLKIFDTNNDGKLDTHDVLWKDLSVWQDANGDGVSDAGEVRTLTQLRIQSISLETMATASQVAEGVRELGRGYVAMDNGSTMAMSAAALSYLDPTHAVI